MRRFVLAALVFVLAPAGFLAVMAWRPDGDKPEVVSTDRLAVLHGDFGQPGVPPPPCGRPPYRDCPPLLLQISDVQEARGPTRTVTGTLRSR